IGDCTHNCPPLYAIPLVLQWTSIASCQEPVKNSNIKRKPMVSSLLGEYPCPTSAPLVLRSDLSRLDTVHDPTALSGLATFSFPRLATLGMRTE
ncbi:unnamed protein product, partial [Fusarium graminearum]